MAIFSGQTLIRTLSLFHLTLAYFFLYSPQTLADQNLVFILGEAMGLPHAQSFEQPSAASALAAVFLAFLGLSDLVAISLPQEMSSIHWGNQAPVRLLFFFILAGYTYLFRPGTSLESAGSKGGQVLGESLGNSVVFTWAFVEMVTWFWIYVTLRDERRQMALMVLAKKRDEEDLM
ncbi:MAG: hypothetical protein M1829_003048 [Trizodia sp. TS-e1964]|nr:MAG: hypothetical protein M1829_003048 [Trizodia sp. TS-e1964]